MPCVRSLPTVRAVLAPAGIRILAALDAAARTLGSDLTVSSGADGDHSGYGDPHHDGNAYDVRSHDFGTEFKQTVLETVMAQLGTATPDSGGLVTDKFFGWLEQAGTPNEHFHFQLRHGQSYP